MAHYTRQALEAARGAGVSSGIPQHADLVIVGAGMSGLYVAWRLLQQENPPSIVIVDKNNRTGGRLDSDVVHFPDHEDVKEEEGGMRFTFDLMDDLMALLAILGIEDQIVPFPMNSGGNNRLLYRDRAFNNAQATENDYAIWSELYHLKPEEQHKNPSSMIDDVFNLILEKNPDVAARLATIEKAQGRTPEYWQIFRLDCNWNGVALKDWTLWSLFDAMQYSNEAITMLYRVLGFNGTFLSEMNAGEAFQLLEDFPTNPGFKTLSNGFSTLPNALVDRVGKDRIHLETRVDRLTRADDRYELIYTRDGVTDQITADKVVLALPRLALEKLYVGSNLVNELPPDAAHRLWNNLQTTTDQPLLKINLYYDKAWWGTLPGVPAVSFGPNFSDLPLGSVYPFYAINDELAAAAEYQEWLVEHDQEPSPVGAENLKEYQRAKYDRPAALTIYCDYLNINFWRSLQDMEEKFTSPLQERYSQPPQTIYPASTAVVSAATELFGKLFDTGAVPAPVMTSARIWIGSTVFGSPPEQQVGYGVHQWGLHADDREVIKAMTQPMPNLFTCGEAFSDYQGWVEGALRSADLVLACEQFGLEPISAVYEREHGVTANQAVSEAYSKRSTEQIRKYIDPDFDPDSAGPRLDTARELPTVHERFDVLLTDRAALVGQD
ncbi:MAG: FAD-dependent oxidoreductase [Solirubrobacteraceae bacterium]|nr:FAD-dependent oxidoreductase [Solirubrobacteraceae bacterium]